jgi:subtilisin family serine protease
MKPLRPFVTAALVLGAFAPLAGAAFAQSSQGAAGPAPAAAAAAPDSSPSNWWLLDESTDHFPGISAERAYRELLAGMQPRRQVVVAVIDGGSDLEHPDLKAKEWTNAREIPGNGRDDDGDGYVDDVHGWNFIGGKDGRDVNQDTYEVTRVYVAGRARFEAPNADTASTPEVRADYQTWKKARAELQSKRAEDEQTLQTIQQYSQGMARIVGILKTAMHADSLTEANVNAFTTVDPTASQARKVFLTLAAQGITQAEIEEERKNTATQLQYGLNPDFNPRPIVGDNYADTHERTYGNPDFKGPTADHGTHVAGIIGAVRGNGIGVDGVTPNSVRLMAVRVVPDGDERDKDVANGIRWAVDHGANVINMSFGKSYSPQKSAVDEAVRYADAHGVLMVHAAGNDGARLDTFPNFPSRNYLGGGQARNWIEVGAVSWKGADSLVATFSNFGKEEVDVFAPGVDILSTFPDGKYERISGTSMAAPVVTGVAALLMSYFPDLTADQVKHVILASAASHATQRVFLPGQSSEVPFGELSESGGIVNVYAAVQMARQMSHAGATH